MATPLATSAGRATHRMRFSASPPRGRYTYATTRKAAARWAARSAFLCWPGGHDFLLLWEVYVVY
jgi:hypothetical protein